jgi:hypothetical protein
MEREIQVKCAKSEKEGWARVVETTALPFYISFEHGACGGLDLNAGDHINVDITCERPFCGQINGLKQSHRKVNTKRKRTNRKTEGKS